MRKRVLACIMTLAVCCSMLSAIAVNAEEEDVVLQFSIWDDEENYIRKVVDQYNAEDHGIQVELQVTASDDYDDKLKVMLAGGADLDLVDIRGVAQATTYASQGALLDITDYIDNSDLDVSNYGAMWETSDYEGDYYALPTRSTCWVLFYNADLFDEAGIEYPGNDLTWEEYGDLAVELQDALGVYGGYWVPWIYQFASVQAGIYVDDPDTSMIQYSLELLNRFYNVDQTHMSYEEMTATSADYIVEFESGRCAMLPNGEWVVNMLMEDEESGDCDINWQVAAMPVPEGVEPETSWGQFQYAAITSECEHPDEAFDFLAYLCGDEGAQVYSQCGMIHAYSSEGAEQALVEASGKDSVSVFFEVTKNQEQPNSNGYEEVLNAFNENAELYLLGETDIDTCISDFSAQRDSILAEYE